MLNVGRLNEGVVLDHIKAGKSMMIYQKNRTYLLPEQVRTRFRCG